MYVKAPYRSEAAPCNIIGGITRDRPTNLVSMLNIRYNRYTLRNRFQIKLALIWSSHSIPAFFENAHYSHVTSPRTVSRYPGLAAPPPLPLPLTVFGLNIEIWEYFVTPLANCCSGADSLPAQRAHKFFSLLLFLPRFLRVFLSLPPPYSLLNRTGESLRDLLQSSRYPKELSSWCNLPFSVSPEWGSTVTSRKQLKLVRRCNLLG